MFLLPLRDENASGATPFVVIALLLLSVGAFIYQVALPAARQELWLNSLAAFPREIVDLQDYGIHSVLPTPLFSLLTSMFLHGGLWHLLGNMLFLWIFADNIEAAMGRGRFLFFYLLTGVLATLAHVLTHPREMLPLVGASGAISGVLGAYFLLFPRNRIYTLLWIIFIIRIVPIPAFFFIGFWFLQQIFFAPAGGQVAWYAHIGGFLAGMALTPLFAQVRVERRR